MPEFVNHLEREPPEIFGCPRPRDERGRPFGFNASCMSDEDTRVFRRSAMQVGGSVAWVTPGLQVRRGRAEGALRLLEALMMALCVALRAGELC